MCGSIQNPYPPQGDSKGGGGWNKSPNFKRKYVPQLKFPEGFGVGGEGSKPQNPPQEGFAYFLEQHHFKTGELA